MHRESERVRSKRVGVTPGTAEGLSMAGFGYERCNGRRCSGPPGRMEVGTAVVEGEAQAVRNRGPSIAAFLSPGRPWAASSGGGD